MSHEHQHEHQHEYQHHHEHYHKSKTKSESVSVWAIIITLLIIVGVVFFILDRNNILNGQAKVYQYTNPSTAPAAGASAGQAASPSVDISQVKIQGEPFVGSANAPVTIAVWFDYQCPFCKRLNQNAISQIVTNYVDSGKVKIVFKDFSFLGPDSDTAALISRAVWQESPSHFFDWYKAMFDKQDGENSGWGSQTDILALTKTIPGINETKVEQLLAKNKAKYQQAIDADKTEGESLGINGTPALVIGQQLIVGAQPYANLKPLIDQQLSK